EPGFWISQGRWAMYVMQSLAVRQPVVAFLPPAVFGLGAAVAYLLLLRAHGIARPALAHCAAFSVFVGFPTWFFILQFAANTYGVALGLVLTGAAALAFRRSVDRLAAAEPSRLALAGLGRDLMLQVLLVGTAIGLYQSFVLLSAACGLG